MKSVMPERHHHRSAKFLDSDGAFFRRARNEYRDLSKAENTERKAAECRAEEEEECLISKNFFLCRFKKNFQNFSSLTSGHSWPETKEMFSIGKFLGNIKKLLGINAIITIFVTVPKYCLALGDATAWGLFQVICTRHQER